VLCFEDDSVDEIEHEMARHQIRRLPDGRKRLVGSRPDVDCSRGA